MSNKDNIKSSISGSSHVRFSAAEYKQLQKDSNRLRKSIPILLKDAYFKRLPTKVLLNHEDLQKLRIDLNRIGNNLNQVARKLNAGFMQGWSDTLDFVLDEFRTLNRYISFGYGIHKS